MDKLVVEILEELRKKQSIMDRVLLATRDIEAMFAANDQEGADQALNIRMDHINDAMACDEKIAMLIDNQELTRSLRLSKLTRGEAEGMELTEDEKIILDVREAIRQTAGSALEVDKRFSTKLIGNSSIYNENK